MALYVKICHTLSGTDTSVGIHLFIASFIAKAKGEKKETS